MIKNRKLLIILTVLILSLLVRELPYVNVLFLNKLWVFYIFLFLYLFPPKRKKFILFLIFLLLGIILILTILNFVVFAEAIGNIIFMLVLVFLVMKLSDFLKEI